MALSTVTLSTRFGSTFAKETSATATKSVIKASSGTLYTVEINNTANTAANTFVKFYDNSTGSVTVGTTGPDVVLKAPGGKTVTYQFALGIAFGTGIVMAAVSTAGTAGTSSQNPASAVIVKVVYD
jgi:hypothetical protein|tara:strand:- start:13337 stop:13714 length:378 start_codon:yes stop_codon:yes gene_type:complete